MAHGSVGLSNRKSSARDAINALAKNVQLGVTKEGKILCVLGDEFANIRFTVEQKIILQAAEQIMKHVEAEKAKQNDATANPLAVGG